MENYYININRQFGSLGRPIAQKLAEILQIEYYDRDIVEEVSQQMEIPLKEASDRDEVAATPFDRMAFPLGSGSGDSQDQMFKVQSKVILDLSKKGSAIFVGRCADYILREKNCFNVFIYAPKEQRYLNCVNSLGMSPSEARRMIEKVDKARNKYYQRYAKHLPMDAEHCHIMIDSSIFGVSGTANVLAELVREHFMDPED